LTKPTPVQANAEELHAQSSGSLIASKIIENATQIVVFLARPKLLEQLHHLQGKVQKFRRLEIKWMIIFSAPPEVLLFRLQRNAGT